MAANTRKLRTMRNAIAELGGEQRTDKTLEPLIIFRSVLEARLRDRVGGLHVTCDREAQFIDTARRADDAVIAQRQTESLDQTAIASRTVWRDIRASDRRVENDVTVIGDADAPTLRFRDVCANQRPIGWERPVRFQVAGVVRQLHIASA